MPPTSVVVIAFEDATRARFVMVRHARRGWELPGGRIEGDEAMLDAAAREFEEETGHTLRDAKPVLVEKTSAPPYAVATGLVGPRGPRGPHAAEPIEEIRFVTRLDDVAPLAFPDDPYEAIGRALGRRLK